MSEPSCDIKAVERLALALMEAHDKRYAERFDAQKEALRVAEENNRHWKDVADTWMKRADERERDFLPRSIGYIIALLSLSSLVLAILQKVK